MFETAAIKSSRPDADYNIEALLSRIKALEERIAKGNFTVSVVSGKTESVAKKEEPVKYEKTVEEEPKSSAIVENKPYINSVSINELKALEEEILQLV